MNINAEEEINKRAKNVSRDDMEDLLGKESTAERLSQKAGFLSQYWEDIKTSFSLIRDWFNGSYDKIGEMPDFVGVTRDKINDPDPLRIGI